MRKNNNSFTKIMMYVSKIDDIELEKSLPDGQKILTEDLTATVNKLSEKNKEYVQSVSTAFEKITFLRKIIEQKNIFIKKITDREKEIVHELKTIVSEMKNLTEIFDVVEKENIRLRKIISDGKKKRKTIYYK